MYNLIDLFSEFGGLFSVLLCASSGIGYYVNSRVHSASLLKEMYLLKLSSKKDPKKDTWKKMNQVTQHLSEINFDERDKFSEVKQYCIKFFCCKIKKDSEKEKMKRTEKIFLKGLYIIQKELDIANILTTINKLKAGLSAVMADDTHLMDRTKRFFYSNSTLFSDSEEEKQMKAKNKFLQFLDQDDR